MMCILKRFAAKSKRRPSLDDYDSGEYDPQPEIRHTTAISKEPCPACDGFGSWYGMAPHDHVGITENPASFIGSTRLHDKSAWPENFSEDPECEGCGVWSCSTCGGSGQVERVRNREVLVVP